MHLVQSAVLRLHVVRPSVCDVGGSGPHRLEILETNCIKNFGTTSRGRTQGLSKIFTPPIYRIGRIARHLCGSSAFLFYYGAMLYAERGYATVCRPTVRPSVCLSRPPSRIFFKITDGWRKIRLIFGLAELSR